MNRLIIILAFAFLALFSSGCNKEKQIEDVPMQLEAVDLGLPSGTLWASQNLFADRPWALGRQYRWGETSEKTDSLGYSMVVDGLLTAYNSEEEYGVVDNRYLLAPEDDAATVILGEEWRIPTQWEFSELKENCNYKTEIINGITGYRFYSKNNENSIFIPRGKSNGWLWGGVSYSYWTSCLYENNKAVSFDAELPCLREEDRSCGMYIRPVLAPRPPVETVSLNPVPRTLIAGSSYQMGVNLTPENAWDKHVEWSMSDSGVVYVDKDGLLTALYPGESRVSAVSPLSGISAETIITVTDYVVPNLVDMGLPSGIMWADRNLTAVNIEDTGLRFSFGQTRPTVKYQKNGYKGQSLPIGCIPPEYDASTVLLGDGWHMPTQEDFKELVDNCEIRKDKNIFGYTLVSKINGASLYIPEGLYPYKYWTAYLEGNQALAFSIIIPWDTGVITPIISSEPCLYGLHIRPVFQK